MELSVTIKQRGFLQQALIKEHKNASKFAWLEAGKFWHTTFRDKRFTPAHAKAAGYAPRQGERSGDETSEFWNLYLGQKIKWKHHRNPLQWSGDVRNRVKSATITSTNTRYSGFVSNLSQTGGGVRIAYPGASKLNYRRWPTSPHMADEFRKVIPSEFGPVARAYDTALEAQMNASTTQTVRKVA